MNAMQDRYDELIQAIDSAISGDDVHAVIVTPDGFAVAYDEQTHTHAEMLFAKSKDYIETNKNELP